MYEIQLSSEHAYVIRDALRLYKDRWAGGSPFEQELISYLETQFTKIVLESYIDA